jgi:D-alanyl-lipoteichoic acid acyltransferase DltB (MBOAT superfamily)
VLFNSYQFGLFFLLMLALYRSLRTIRQRNWLLFIAGSVFYASWSPAYLLLLYASVVVDYGVGRAMGAYEHHRKAILMASLVVNLGILALFKYADFFLLNLSRLTTAIGLRWHPHLFAFTLPLGISFYTFLTLSYTIDVYRRITKPERSLLNYGVFVTFFPHLIAGPILRANEFLPQVEQPHPENLRPWFGINRIAFGLVKKVLLADTLATFVEPVFAGPGSHDGAACLLATYAYAFQIFLDFSGYCDIAIGTAALLGYELPFNFDSPYLARDITAFWRRWHMSLSSWLRDYLYIPLGGNRKGTRRTYINLLLTMLLGGLWHGASWNFVIWGGIHGTMLSLHKRWTRDRAVTPAGGEDSYAFSWSSVLLFQCVCLAWIFFRATTLGDAGSMLRSIALLPAAALRGTISPLRVILALAASPCLLLVYSFVARLRRRWEVFAPATLGQAAAYGSAMGSLATAMAIFAAPPAQFIYFQF